MTDGTLGPAMAAVPLRAPGVPGPNALGLTAAPTRLANLNTVYQVVDLSEAHTTAMHVLGANPGVHGFGVSTALGNCFMF